jgi:cysteinyl-tRNA synthetase
MLKTHYRQPLDWTYSSLDEAHGILWDWYGELKGVLPDQTIPDRLVEYLNDDLNTPAVISTLHELRRKDEFRALLAALNFLGFSGARDKIERVPNCNLDDEDAVGLTVRTMIGALAGTAREKVIEDFILTRSVLRKKKDFVRADRIRDELAAAGIILKDAKDPTTGELVTTWEVVR